MEDTLLSNQEIMNAALEYRLSGGKFKHEDSLNGKTGISWDFEGTHYYIYCGRRGGVFVQIDWTSVQQLEGTVNMSLHSSRALVRWINRIYQTANEIEVLPEPETIQRKKAANIWRLNQGGKRMVRRKPVLPVHRHLYRDLER